MGSLLGDDGVAWREGVCGSDTGNLDPVFRAGVVTGIVRGELRGNEMGYLRGTRACRGSGTGGVGGWRGEYWYPRCKREGQRVLPYLDNFLDGCGRRGKESCVKVPSTVCDRDGSNGVE